MKVINGLKWIFPVMLTAASMAPLAVFAEEQVEVSLTAGISERVILTSGNDAFAGDFLVDPSQIAYVAFGSPRKTLQATLISPSGARYSMGAPDSNGVHSFVYPDRTTPNLTGLNYIFELNTPEVGLWRYVIEDSEIRGKEYPVFFQLNSDSPVKGGVMGGGFTYTVGNDIALSTVVLNSQDKLTDYSVSGQVTQESAGSPGESISFADDGGVGDASAGDGISTGLYIPQSPGTYWFKGRIQGVLANGNSYERSIETRFKAVPAYGRIQSALMDRGIDTDNDGYFDKLGVTLPVDVRKAGNFLAHLTLTTSSGASFTASGTASLTNGSANIEVQFGTQQLRAIGDDGPYHVSRAILEYLEPDNAFVVDRAFELGQTSAWSVSQFEREPIEVVRVTKTVGSDFNNNGLYDRLSVTLDMDVIASGYYRWSASLGDSQGTELGFAAGNTYLSGNSTITMNFPGTPIGENAVDGPFLIKNFIIYGRGHSRIINLAGKTDALSAALFEGYVQPDTEPPVLTLRVTPGEIWPPNHQMVEVSVSYDVTDNMDPAPIVELVSVASSDGENEIGDGNHSPDIDITEDGRIFVRAERAGPKESRIYTITYSARDAAGNTALDEAIVTVLHDKGK